MVCFCITLVGVLFVGLLVRLFVCVSVRLTFRLSPCACLSPLGPVWIGFALSVCLSVCRSLCCLFVAISLSGCSYVMMGALSVWQSVDPSVCVESCMSVCLFARLRVFVCLFGFVSIPKPHPDIRSLSLSIFSLSLPLSPPSLFSSHRLYISLSLSPPSFFFLSLSLSLSLSPLLCLSKGHLVCANKRAQADEQGLKFFSPPAMFRCVQCCSYVSFPLTTTVRKQKCIFALCLEIAASQRAWRSCRNFSEVRCLTWLFVAVWLLARVIAQEAPKTLKMAFQFCTFVGAHEAPS